MEDLNEAQTVVLNGPTFIKTYPAEFDFISIDIEGCEMEVLPFMDLSKVKMICIEWNGRQDLKVQYEYHLKGFNLRHTTKENLIYVK